MSLARFLTVEFNEIANRVRSAKIAVGMITLEKFDFFLRKLPSTAEVSVICGVHMPTPPKVMKRLKTLTDDGEIEAKVYTARFFHPKLYLFELQSGWVAFVGSGNFTNGGWVSNKELFVKITDSPVIDQLKMEFDQWHGVAKPITDRFLALYTESFLDNAANYTHQRATTERLIDAIHENFNIDNINFSNQFFSRQDHEAFAPGKTHLDTPEILREREATRRNIYHLNDLLKPLFPRQWDLHEHYEEQYIVASPYTERHHDLNVKGLWVGYGRGRDALKKYGSDSTPLNFMRMQVIVKYDRIGVWLMPGKSGGGWVDREQLANQLEDEVFRRRFCSEVKNLGDDYFLDVGGRLQKLSELPDAQAVYHELLKDNWRYYYLTIGKDYPLGTTETSRTQLVETVIRDFGRMFPLYEMIRDKTFDPV